MKYSLYTLMLFLGITYSCTPHSVPKQNELKLTISMHINQDDTLNKRIIHTLEKFLATVDASQRNNIYWEKSDLEKYHIPYYDLYNQRKHFAPTLLEIIDTQKEEEKLVKLAYIYHADEENENHLSKILTIIANCKKDEILFSNYLNISVQNWTELKKGSICYKISPQKKINESEILEQEKVIEKLCQFFKVKPIPITYYSCTSPAEIFRIRGFDYAPVMYNSKTGGIVYPWYQVFSGNNKEIYVHEITHIYIENSFPAIQRLLDEGMATFWGGSGEHSYAWHKEKLKKYFTENPTTFKPEQYLDPYSHKYAYKETPISYMIGALICERTLRLYGKERLFELFSQQGELMDILLTVGLNEKNLNEELLKEATLPPFEFSFDE